MRMMSRCFTRFPIGVLGEPNLYHDSGVFYKEVGGCGGVPVVDGVCETCEIVIR